MLLTAAFIVIVAGMRVASPLLVPFLLAIFLSVLCSPPLVFLQNRKVPTALAILIIMLVLILLGGILGTIFTSSLAAFAADIPIYTARLEEVAGGFFSWLSQRGIVLMNPSGKSGFRCKRFSPTLDRCSARLAD